jgi:hypothetical protein
MALLTSRRTRDRMTSRFLTLFYSDAREHETLAVALVDEIGVFFLVL